MKKFPFFKLNKLVPLNQFLSKNFCKLDIDRFISEVDKTLNDIGDQLEAYELEIAENISLSDGVLKLSFSNNKNYVINIQRPNMQIWFSSPISGPQRFEYDQSTKTWKNIRNDKELYSILNDEINKIIKDNNLDVRVKLISKF